MNHDRKRYQSGFSIIFTLRCLTPMALYSNYTQLHFAATTLVAEMEIDSVPVIDKKSGLPSVIARVSIPFDTSFIKDKTPAEPHKACIFVLPSNKKLTKMFEVPAAASPQASGGSPERKKALKATRRPPASSSIRPGTRFLMVAQPTTI